MLGLQFFLEELHEVKASFEMQRIVFIDGPIPFLNTLDISLIIPIGLGQTRGFFELYIAVISYYILFLNSYLAWF